MSTKYYRDGKKSIEYVPYKGEKWIPVPPFTMTMYVAM